MRLVNMWVPDSVYNWIEQLLGRDLVLEGRQFQIGDVDDSNGQLFCKAIFQVAQQYEGGSAELVNVIDREDKEYAKQTGFGILDKHYVVMIELKEGCLHCAIPVRTIAEDRARYYANKLEMYGGDVERSLREDTVPLFVRDHSAIHEWFGENMFWFDMIQYMEVSHSVDVDCVVDDEVSESGGMMWEVK